MLSEDQKRSYRDNGYLVLPGFSSADAIQQIRQRAQTIVAQFDAERHRTIFTTDKQLDHVDRYFLESADGVSCFFEEGAFAQDGQLCVDKALSINKIGHALHRRDAVFEAFSCDRSIVDVARDLGLSDPQIWQSMYIFKQPGIGGAVNWHQDATFFYTEPITVTTFWFALEEATVDNGCLYVQPGGHRGPLRERFRLVDGKVSLDQEDATPWPTPEQSVALPVEAGTLVCFHGKLPHFSEANRSADSRHAYTLHLTCGSSRYSPRNWIQSKKDVLPQ